MNVKRYVFSRYLAAAGTGLLVIGGIIFVIKLLLDVAYLVAGALALAGLILLIVGFVYRRV